MEQAILALLGISITLTLYLDRGRRADDALIRKDMNDGFAQIRTEMHNGFAQIRTEMHEGDNQIRTEMHEGFKEARAERVKLRDDMNDGFKWVHQRIDKLTEVVMDLCRRVGRLEVRSEGWDPKPDPSQ